MTATQAMWFTQAAPLSAARPKTEPEANQIAHQLESKQLGINLSVFACGIQTADANLECLQAIWHEVLEALKSQQ